MSLKTGYCPICDKVIYVYSNNSHTYCHKCDHHIALHEFNEKLDRHTALSVLQDISSRMYPDVNLFGQKTLVIRREDFEKIRAKYLDRKG